MSRTDARANRQPHRMMIALSLLLALLPLVTMAQQEDPLRAPRLDDDELAAIKAEFKAIWSVAVAKKQHGRDASSSSSDGGIDGDKHTRRVPIFAAAAIHSRDVLVPLIDAAVTAGINGCESPAAEIQYCEAAVRCIALHTLTHHWNKLHLLQDECQGIVDQFDGAKNKKFFNPDDKDALNDVEEEMIDDVLPEFGLARQKYRVICDQDFVCNQKVDCFLSAPIVEKYNITKLVRCPYGDFEESSISSSAPSKPFRFHYADQKWATSSSD